MQIFKEWTSQSCIWLLQTQWRFLDGSLPLSHGVLHDRNYQQVGNSYLLQGCFNITKVTASSKIISFTYSFMNDLWLPIQQFTILTTLMFDEGWFLIKNDKCLNVIDFFLQSGWSSQSRLSTCWQYSGGRPSVSWSNVWWRTHGRC